MAKSKKSLRRPLIRLLLDQGNLSKRQIAKSANCSVGYVYQVSWDYELEKKQMAKNLEQMKKISQAIEQTYNKPAAFSDDWNPPTWKLALMAVPAAVLIYLAVVFVFSLN
jgi:hypothetical protein